MASYIVEYIFETLCFFLISFQITFIIFIQLLLLMAYLTLENSLQFYSWEFFYNTSLACASLMQNELLKNFLNNNGLLYF